VRRQAGAAEETAKAGAGGAAQRHSARARLPAARAKAAGSGAPVRRALQRAARSERL